MIQKKTVDVLVIGGGINGAGIARDCVGRGLSVMLCEKDDLASATSSASTKLIHGGLRYLEHYEFRLVREALMEREVLMHAAHHIIWPMTFVLPYHKKLRPRWMIRLGLFLYDHLAPRVTLPSSRGFRMVGTAYGHPLKGEFEHGFSYSDCWVEDTRLVVLNALDAHERGAEILTRTACTALKPREEGGWTATLHDNINEEVYDVDAALVVNASGPWVDKTLGLTGQEGLGKFKIRHVKGSHIIVPRLSQGEHAYILQNKDNRIVFVIPYEKKYSLIGTTDVDYKGDIESVTIEEEEVTYLCGVVNGYFRQTIAPEDVLWSYSGVRPLVDDGKGSASNVTRDYILDIQTIGVSKMISVYGGKITTYRCLAETMGDKVVEMLGRGGGAWTNGAFLPGGEAVGGGFDTFYKIFRKEYNWLPESLAVRYARAYGGRARDLLRGCKRLSEMGEHLGDSVYEAEIRFLVHGEWAMSLEDVLWRRSKLGLHTTEETQNNISECLKKIFNGQ